MIFYLVILSLSTNIGAFVPAKPFTTPEECMKQLRHMESIARSIGDDVTRFACIGKGKERL